MDKSYYPILLAIAILLCTYTFVEVKSTKSKHNYNNSSSILTSLFTKSSGFDLTQYHNR